MQVRSIIINIHCRWSCELLNLEEFILWYVMVGLSVSHTGERYDHTSNGIFIMVRSGSFFSFTGESL